MNHYPFLNVAIEEEFTIHGDQSVRSPPRYLEGIRRLPQGSLFRRSGATPCQACREARILSACEQNRVLGAASSAKAHPTPSTIRPEANCRPCSPRLRSHGGFGLGHRCWCGRTVRRSHKPIVITLLQRHVILDKPFWIMATLLRDLTTLCGCAPGGNLAAFYGSLKSDYTAASSIREQSRSAAVASRTASAGTEDTARVCPSAANSSSS